MFDPYFYQMVSVGTIGFELLNEEEKNIFEKVLKDYMYKIEGKVKNISSVKIHLKEGHIEGKRKRYDLHVKIIVPKRNFEASASDWDFSVTLHQVFKRIEEEIENSSRK